MRFEGLVTRESFGGLFGTVSFEIFMLWGSGLNMLGGFAVDCDTCLGLMIVVDLNSVCFGMI